MSNNLRPTIPPNLSADFSDSLLYSAAATYPSLASHFIDRTFRHAPLTNSSIGVDLSHIPTGTSTSTIFTQGTSTGVANGSTSTVNASSPPPGFKFSNQVYSPETKHEFSDKDKATLNNMYHYLVSVRDNIIKNKRSATYYSNSLQAVNAERQDSRNLAQINKYLQFFETEYRGALKSDRDHLYDTGNTYYCACWYSLQRDCDEERITKQFSVVPFHNDEKSDTAEFTAVCDKFLKNNDNLQKVILGIGEGNVPLTRLSELTYIHTTEGVGMVYPTITYREKAALRHRFDPVLKLKVQILKFGDSLL
jgi:hypothetical protein